jgi:membrane-associated protease RseP (regulator of RpoE activity)
VTVPLTWRQAALHAGLFLAACATTAWAQGPAFAATLMAILLCHEFGHYIVARRHGVDASLPYFIPLPPQISFGTLGAVIRMRSPLVDRSQLLDVGAAGPLAGVAVALPLLVLGLSWSEVGPIPPDSVIEGNSILYAAIKYAMFGRWLPADGLDVQLHPVAFASWVGLLVTMINLIPIGQLDGGHVARAALGDRHERMSAVLHRALPVVGLVVGAALTVDARRHGLGWSSALGYAATAAMPWLVWAVLLVVMRRLGGGAYHPPVGDTVGTPGAGAALGPEAGAALGAGRRRLAWAVLVLWLLILTPVPLRPAL